MADLAGRTHKTRPVAMCPIRINEPCLLCESGATGPEDCALVWLVMTDPDLRERLHEMKLEALAEARA
jgi:hypothetical protein